MPLSLTMEKGEPKSAVFALKSGENILGRSSTAGVRLGSPDISGQHAKITVTGEQAVLENLSRFGTRVDEVEITGPVTLAPGQRIGLGKATTLLFGAGAEPQGAPATLAAPPETRGTVMGKATTPAPRATMAAAPQESVHEAATGKGLARPTAAANDDRTRAMPSGGAEAEPLSRPDWTTEAGASGETRAMQTRAASPEEIEFLKVTEQKKIRRRITLGLVVAIPLLLLVIIFRPKPPPPEKEFEWPKNAAGEYLDGFEPAPSGGIKDGGYDVSFPATPGFRKRNMAGGIAVECDIGRDLNVPVRIFLQEELDKKFAGMTRSAFVEDWIQQMAASGGRWNFDRPAPSPLFQGTENGIPGIRVTYQRDGNGTWFGVATVIRHGIRRIAIRAEAPSTERARAERILSAQYFRPSTDFLRAYWEPVPEVPKMSESDILRQVRQELDRMAPATWMETESLLAGLLTKAVLDMKPEIEREAIGLLAKLREREALWFNSQYLAFHAAVSQGSRARALKIAEYSKGIFSNPEDQRYYTVRKWKVEP